MLTGTGKIVSSSKGNSGILYIPSDLMTDSQFPINDLPAKVRITIDNVNKRLIIDPI
jgi:hypothetical protein